LNSRTIIIVTVVGIMFGIGGIVHDFIEVPRGNTPTNGLDGKAIDENLYLQSTEEAF